MSSVALSGPPEWRGRRSLRGGDRRECARPLAFAEYHRVRLHSAVSHDGRSRTFWRRNRPPRRGGASSMGTLEALLREEGVRVPRPLFYCKQKGGAPDRVPLLERICQAAVGAVCCTSMPVRESPRSATRSRISDRASCESREQNSRNILMRGSGISGGYCGEGRPSPVDYWMVTSTMTHRFFGCVSMRLLVSPSGTQTTESKSAISAR